MYAREGKASVGLADKWERYRSWLFEMKQLHFGKCWAMNKGHGNARKPERGTYNP